MKTLLFTLTFLWTLSFTAQDPFFYSTRTLRVYNNPAFSGLNKSFSADVGYRHQWPRVSGDYITSVTAFNQYLGKGNGVSLQLFTDNAAQTIYKRQITVGYAKRVRLADDHFLSAGVDLSYFQKRLDPSRLTFGGMIDPRQGYVYPASGLGQYKTTVANMDMSAGVMYYSSFLYAGFSIKHITEPDQSFLLNLTSPDVLPRMYFGQLGAKFRLGEDWSLVPHLEFRSQGSFQTLLSGLKVNWKKFYFNGGIQNFNTFYTALGFEAEHVRFAYDLVTYTGFGNDEVFFAHEFFVGLDLTLFKKENENFFDF
ncbi:PorP/SprF family type IX secretion system membrane protein [Parvicella tangerina]|uniref:Type IX secretion system membrane protein PorP/SprF n=1 Tax=Parvicella tangerina TaxID=2829795 RepID=A0A916JQI2_9FLAO|nr:PorP/SprF family type IX secretion system membrane protein [Parvicella tangerina]CAG5086310.1 hypothetical protein CRYO30217_03078 [Parvicella tangerina]